MDNFLGHTVLCVGWVAGCFAFDVIRIKNVNYSLILRILRILPPTIGSNLVAHLSYKSHGHWYIYWLVEWIGARAQKHHI